MTRKKQIEELRRSFIDGQHYTITFNESLWRGKERKRNCLAYALNMVNGRIKKKFLGKDYLSHLLQLEIKQAYSVEEVYERFMNFFDLIGIKYKTCDLITKVPVGYYKIVMLIETGDVHWLRQDEDGTWSHKPGWVNRPQNRDKSNKPILNPQEADIEISGEILKIQYFLIAHKKHYFA